MKKFLSIFSILFAFAALNANAEVKLYLNDTNLQVGTDGVIELCIEAENAIGTVNAVFELPEGVTVTKIVSEGAAVTFNKAENNLLLGKGDPYFSSGVVAQIYVNVAEDVALGDYPMTVTFGKIVEPSLKTYDFANVESTLTIQKTAVIDPQDSDYAFEIIPFTLAANETKDIPVYMKNVQYVSGLSFTVTYPENVQAGNKKSGMSTTWTKPTINTEMLYSTEYNPQAKADGDDEITPLSAKVSQSNSGQVATYTIDPTGDLFLTSEDEYKQIMTISVKGKSGLEAGVYYLKISDISIKSFEPTDDEPIEGTISGGEYYASIFSGTPTETDPVVYGHYTAEGTAALNSVAENFRTVEMSAATIDEGCVVNDVLVYTKDATSYNRAVDEGRYATICVPFALEGDYYVVSSITSSSITLKEVSEVAANTPAITKGAIAVSGEANVALGTPSVGENNLTGTYEYLPNVEGYYLANNKFYNDGAEIKPFRAYIPGTGAKCLSVYLETANGVIDITNELSNEDIYSLQGIKMNNTRKGINIVGGKKIYVK